ncbi:MAG: alpha/beta hydrolase [Acidobacteria bacterium]|nr:alpha/beta hydrolase [Acidobacteriota bacterium]
MTIVLLHGNPETSAIWRELVREWRRDDIVTPSLPGFGCEVPQGFGCTMDEYLTWLVDLVLSLEEPVHVVGHDWGGILVARLAIVAPTSIASWASDALGALHPRYEWHSAARVWQTDGAGEELVASMTNPPVAERQSTLEALGVPTAAAEILAEVADQRMGKALLALYRSARQPAMIQWGENPERARVTRGMFLHATNDPYVGTARGTRELAASMGAEVGELTGLGHWWMLEDSRAAVQVLDEWVNRD